MPLQSDQSLLDQKKKFIRHYVVLLKQINEFFEQRFVETLDKRLHSDNDKKTQLLFEFIHYISIRAMKSVIIEFNQAGNVQDKKLFKLYDLSSTHQSLEPYVLIDSIDVFSFSMAKKLLDELRHTQPLTRAQYAQASKAFIDNLKVFKNTADYKNKTCLLFTNARMDLMRNVKDKEEMTLDQFYLRRKVGILVAVAVVVCVAIYASLLAAVLSGCVVLGVGYVIHAKYQSTLSMSSQTFIPQAFQDEELQAMLGEDFEFPQSKFLDRVDQQLRPWIQDFLIADGVGADPKLLLENGGSVKPVLGDDTRPAHKRLESVKPSDQVDRTQEVLSIMDAAINKSRLPPRFPQITGGGYHRNGQFRIANGGVDRGALRPGEPLRIEF